MSVWRKLLGALGKDAAGDVAGEVAKQALKKGAAEVEKAVGTVADDVEAQLEARRQRLAREKAAREKAQRAKDEAAQIERELAALKEKARKR